MSMILFFSSLVTNLQNRYELLQNNYILALTIFVTFFILSKLVVYISERIILQLTKKTKSDVDDILVERLNNPISLILIILGVQLAIYPFNFATNTLKIIEYITMPIIIVILAYMAIVIVDTLTRELGAKIAGKTKMSYDNDLIPIFRKFLRAIIVILAIIFILNVWGFEIGPFLAGLGIAGIAVAFALQNSLANIFGGISIILDQSIRRGDVIRVDTETTGTVVDVGLRATKIRTWDNELVVVPNGVISNSQFTNYILPDPKVRVVVSFGVEYGSDVDKVKKVVMDVMKKQKGLLDDPAPSIRFDAMADFSLNFRAMVWVKSFAEKIDAKENLTTDIYKALNKAKIGIPFPTHTVYTIQQK